MTSAENANPYHPQQLFGMQGRNVLVIGAGGLGTEAALGLAGAGAVVAAADIEIARAEKTAQKIRLAGGCCAAYDVDVCSSASVASLINRVVDAQGAIHAAVVATGVTRRGASEDFKESDWDDIIGVNLKGCFLCCQALGRHMLALGGGSIVLFSSIAGSVGLKNSPAYAASKGGVNQITRTLAIEWADKNIRVNAIAPSYFDTDMVASHDDPELAALFKKRLELVPMARMGKPGELVGAVVFLASSASSMITGIVLPIDGGYLAQ